jgi:hypothetical protein
MVKYGAKMMNKDSIMDYIRFQIGRTYKKTVWMGFVVSFVFSLALLFLAVMSHDTGLLVFITVTDIFAVVVSVCGTISSRKDVLILANAFTDSIMVMIFVLTCYTLVKYGTEIPTPAYAIFFGMLPYVTMGVFVILLTRQQIKRGDFRNKQHRKVSLPFGIIGLSGVIMPILLRRTNNFGIETETLIIIVAWAIIVVTLLISFGFNQYLCFYYMRKYGIK